MPFQDDSCDFCGRYCDPIGCDTKRNANGKFWCGQCRQGRDAQWGEWPTERVQAERDRYQKLYAADPIDWEHPESNQTIEGLRAHWRRLEYQDLAYILDEVLKDRGVTA